MLKGFATRKHRFVLDRSSIAFADRMNEWDSESPTRISKRDGQNKICVIDLKYLVSI